MRPRESISEDLWLTLFSYDAGESVLVKRGEPFPESPSNGPIYVCTRNDALAGIIDSTPPERRADLVFMQNGSNATLNPEVPFFGSLLMPHKHLECSVEQVLGLERA